MITISHVVEEIVRKSPFIEEAMARDLINLSALAREIRPEVEELLIKDVREGAIIMALKRLAPRIKYNTSDASSFLKKLENITIKSNLVEFTFQNSTTLTNLIRTLMDKIKKDKNEFITVAGGILEVSIILNSGFADYVKKLFKDENLVILEEDLSSMTIKLPPENVKIPGVYYTILKIFAWHNLNIIDIVSTSHEITLFFKDRDIDKAFTIFKKSAN